MAQEIKKDGIPVQFNGKSVFESTPAITSEPMVKKVDAEQRILTIVGSDETVDRDGDIIRVKGWILDWFVNNPVFLYGHDYGSVPIGGAVKVVKKTKPKQLLFFEKFPPIGMFPFADLIFNMFHAKFLNASSVGFIPFDYKDHEEEDIESSERPIRPWSRQFIKQELLELSAVPVPSNPSALQDGLKGLGTIDPLLLECASKGLVPEQPEILEEVGLKDFFESITVEPVKYEEHDGIFKLFVPSEYVQSKMPDKVVTDDDIEVTTVDVDDPPLEDKSEETSPVSDGDDPPEGDEEIKTVIADDDVAPEGDEVESERGKALREEMEALKKENEKLLKSQQDLKQRLLVADEGDLKGLYDVILNPTKGNEKSEPPKKKAAYSPEQVRKLSTVVKTLTQLIKQST